MFFPKDSPLPHLTIPLICSESPHHSPHLSVIHLWGDLLVSSNTVILFTDCFMPSSWHSDERQQVLRKHLWDRTLKTEWIVPKCLYCPAHSKYPIKLTSFNTCSFLPIHPFPHNHCCNIGPEVCPDTKFQSPGLTTPREMLNLHGE